MVSFCMMKLGFITFFLTRYQSQLKTVVVSNGEATKINFTLTADDTTEWSETNDFGLEANVKAAYLDNSEIDSEMAQLENDYHEIAEFIANDNTWSVKVHGVLMTAGDSMVRGRYFISRIIKLSFLIRKRKRLF